MRPFALLLLACLLGAGGFALAASPPGATCTRAACATRHDRIPNFAASPTIRSAASGSWSDPRTWRPARVPSARDVVSIAGGTTVLVDGGNARARTIGVQRGGRLRWATSGAPRLTAGTVLVLPGGALELGTPAAPVTGRAELVIAGESLDLRRDPYQFGTGLLVVDGELTVHGAPRTAFARLAREPRRGDRALRLAQPVSGWRAGDRLVLPDSRHFAVETVPEYELQGEQGTVASVSADGRTVTLRAPLRFDHPGARDGNDRLDFLPHVGNLTRSVVVRSAKPSGTRGHVLATGRSAVDVRYAAFRNLGRTTVDKLDVTRPDDRGSVVHVGTNQAGRYPLHVHHLAGPRGAGGAGYQYRLVGNVVDDDAQLNRRKWAITIHDSHYGLVRENVVHNGAGWGIGTEIGNESFNVIERNFVVRVRGQGGGERSEAGRGYWFRGPNNVVRDNVAANVMSDGPMGGVGFDLYFVYLGEIAVPRFRGADTAVDGEARTLNGNATALREFSGNEVYGATETGLQIYWLGTVDTKPLRTRESVVRDFRAWNFSRYGYYGYPANHLTFDGFTARGDRSVIENRHEFVLGIWFGDYMNQGVTIRDADIQNLRSGIVTPSFGRGTTTIAGSYLRNARNIVVPSIGAPGSAPHGPSMPPKATVIRDVRFRTVRGPTGGGGQCAVDMAFSTQNGSANLVQPDVVTVLSYNGRRGDDFRVFYREQRPLFELPVSEGNLAGAPVAGLTNAAAWARHRLAIAGAVATGASPRRGICGLVRRLP
jgi:hypothetical protein